MYLLLYIYIYIFLSSNRWHVLLSKFSQCRWPLGLELYGASPLADLFYFLCFTNVFLAARLWWYSSRTRRQAFSCCFFLWVSLRSCHMRWGCEKFNFIFKKVLHPVQSGRYHRDVSHLISPVCAAVPLPVPGKMLNTPHIIRTMILNKPACLAVGNRFYCIQHSSHVKTLAHMHCQSEK